MSELKINIDEIKRISSLMGKTKLNVNNLKNSLNYNKRQVNYKILNRNNLDYNFNNVANELNDLEQKLQNIKNVLDSAANIYTVAEASVNKKKTENLFEKIVKEVDKLQKSPIVGKTKKRKILGFDCSGEGGIDFFKLDTGSIKHKSNFKSKNLSGKKWTKKTGDKKFKEEKIKKGEKAKTNVTAYEAGIKGELNAVKMHASGNIGDGLTGEVEVDVVHAEASGAVGCGLFENGKFTPNAYAKASAEVSALKGSASFQGGNEKFNVHADAEGSVLKASAEAEVGVGVITTKDKNGKEVQKLGVKAKAGAEACLAEGTISGGLTIFGVKIDVGVTGKAASVGASAEFEATTGGAKGEIGASALLGVGLSIGVDWTGFTRFQIK